MNVFRIAPNDFKGLCHGCHNKAFIEIGFGAKRPALRLCARDASFLGRTLLQRLEEAEKGMPIPARSSHAREQDDSRGNR